MARPSKEKEIKEKIYAAALTLISENGFHDSPMSKLAKLAKVSVGSFYLYFSSKEQLIQNLFAHVRNEMGISILHNYKETDSIEKRFDTLFNNIFDHYLKNKSHFYFMEQFAVSAFNSHSIEALSDEAQKVFLKLHKEGVKQKILKNIPIEVTLSLTSGPIISLVKKHFYGFLPLSKQTIKITRNCVWNAISVL